MIFFSKRKLSGRKQEWVLVAPVHVHRYKETFLTIQTTFPIKNDPFKLKYSSSAIFKIRIGQQCSLLLLLVSDPWRTEVCWQAPERGKGVLLCFVSLSFCPSILFNLYCYLNLLSWYYLNVLTLYFSVLDGENIESSSKSEEGNVRVKQTWGFFRPWK